jgi:hypothetical protein
MNPKNIFARDSGAHPNPSDPAALAFLDETLRLIAKLPPPAGLEDRIYAGVQAGVQAGVRAGLLASSKAGLKAESQAGSRFGRLLLWPAQLKPQGAWMESAAVRAAAAAAIVCVVLGGGWGIHSRFHRAPLPAAISQPPASPARIAAPSGFSSAGAMHTPLTLNGPVVAQPAKTEASPDEAQTVKLPKATPATKAAPQSALAPLHRAKRASTGNAIAPPAK